MTRNSTLSWLCMVLGMALFVAYAFVPFVNQPELGPSTLTFIGADRDNNAVDLETNGMELVAFGALLALGAGLWGGLNPTASRMASALTAVGGVFGLLYLAVLARSYRSDEASYAPLLGPGFWAILLLCSLMLTQLFIPHTRTEERYRLRRILANQESAIIIALLLLLLLVGVANPRFLSDRNLLDVLQGNAYIAVAAIGMSLVIITGNIDISVGSLVGLLAVICGQLATHGVPVFIAWLAPLVIGALVGAFIGWLVTHFKIPSIVVTLGMFSILKGILIIWTGGTRVSGMPSSFYLAQWRPFDIPMPIYFMVVLTIATAIWMRYSQGARAFYAVGGNAEAARLSGYSPEGLVMKAFIINGVFVGIAAVLYATQLNIIQATPPPNLELVVITAAVVGGVSILGGTGTVIGAMLAAILLNAIRSSMVFFNVSPFWIQAVSGVLILVTVLADLLRRRRQRV